MKFARYLQDTQTPEWKKAYIDYRRLKKRITAIRQWQDGLEPLPSSGDENDPRADVKSGSLQASSSTNKHHGRLPSKIPVAQTAIAGPSLSSSAKSDMETGMDADEETVGESEIETKNPRIKIRAQTLPNQMPYPSSTPSNRKTVTRHRPFMVTSARSHSSLHPMPLHDLLPTLPPIHLAFFTCLDAQLEKIESFYLAREKEAQARSKALQIQLQELKDHRKIFYDAHPNNHLSWSDTFRSNFQVLPLSLSLPTLHPKPTSISISTMRRRAQTPLTGKVKLTPGESNGDSDETEVEIARPNVKGKRRNDFDEDENQSGSNTTASPAKNPDALLGATQPTRLDPDEYQHAKKKLKRAVLEHYRGLEVLNNYRILNITGFRKALKKYEKITMIPALQAYMKEKVDTSAFSSDVSIGIMLRQAEESFAARFERGDKKRAMVRLRAVSQHRSHHSSTFRSGIALGLAVPAFVSGVYQSLQTERRSQIPSWQVLLFIYSVFLIPVLFSLLVGLNLLVWANARINYVFIFELDVRTRLDHREYFEIPAILLATLIYAFWLSFSHIAEPTIWPIVWLVFVVAVMVNPIPILFKSSRWWLLRSVGDLLISGSHQVEFTDFWMGDQFCSLVFTLSNLYFTFCAYGHDLHPTVWERCGNQSQAGWTVSFVLAILPLLARLVQSVRRYSDSKLITHLINAGKYGSGIIYYFFYFLWRHHGVTNRGGSFILWCFCGTFYSTYACTWDFLMDWSFFKPHARYPLLRSDLIYSNEIPLYYFALISNVLIRFIWILYIPQRGPSITLRTFIGGILEMLRRWQWNFYRLENEHLGNMDQYRVTREVPLPYQFDETVQEEEDGDEDGISRRRWLRPQNTVLTNLKPVVPHDNESHII